MIWIEVLPTEFFFLEEAYAFFGGQSVYYMGYYAYGASVTTIENRATTMGRYDGVEQGGMLLGTILSPFVLKAIGYLGCYITKLVLFIMAFVYLVFFVREPIKSSPVDNKESNTDSPSIPILSSIWNLIRTFLVQPFLEIVHTVIQKRPNGLRWILFIQLFVHGMYWFLVDQNAQMQLYFLHVREVHYSR